MTVTTVSTSAALVSALKSAHGGDTIQLAAGNYSAVTLNNLHFATAVTVTSQDPTHAAVINGLTLKSSNGLNFTDLEFAVRGPALSSIGVQVLSSRDVDFDGIHVHGSLDDNPGNDIGGLLVRESSDVSVVNATFEQLFWGVAHLDSDHVEVRDSEFHDIRMDGVRGGGSSHVTIAGNQFRDFNPNPGDHGDAIQFWTINTKASAHDILIENNVVQRGDGEATQGIFMRDILHMPFQDVTIRGNLLIGTGFNSIGVFGAKNVTIEDNIVQGLGDLTSWIHVETSDRVTLTDNLANLFNITGTVTHLTSTGSQVIAKATDGGAAMTHLWDSHNGSTAPAPAPPITAPAPLNLVGAIGNDTLTGGALGDTLSDGGGADLLSGGAGDDVFVVIGKPTIVEALGGGLDTLRTTQSLTLPVNVENIVLIGTTWARGYGNGLANKMTGNDKPNILEGAGGADTLDGGGGPDTLNGGAGDDIITGGAGADVFLFQSGCGHDVVRDFGAGDTLNISNLLKTSVSRTVVDIGADVKISFSTGDSIVLANVDPAHLAATTSGYIFV